MNYYHHCEPNQKGSIFGKIKKSNPIAEYQNSIQFERTNEKGLSLTVFEQRPDAESA
jgi:hypothetical protein